MDSEKIAIKFLSKYKLQVERFDKKIMNKIKTPDFKVFYDNQFEFYCEVKNTKMDKWLDEKLDNSENLELVGGYRCDPIYNRITTHIHKARKQFDAVNEDFNFPNVLLFYNEDDNSGFDDLCSVITGKALCEDGSELHIFKNYSEGRIKKDIEKISLIIWLDHSKKENLFWINNNKRFLNRLCDLLNIDSSKIKFI